jgi:rhodanese-related sulfurtransferase
MGILSRLFSLSGQSSRISAQEAKQIMDENKCVVLDVRTPGEFSQGKIRGAKNIPVDELERRAGKMLPDKDALILVYCHSGVRASSAVYLLSQLGYTNVKNFGGIISWPYGTK